jgi:hypothetical protein
MTAPLSSQLAALEVEREVLAGNLAAGTVCGRPASKRQQAIRKARLSALSTLSAFGAGAEVARVRARRVESEGLSK